MNGYVSGGAIVDDSLETVDCGGSQTNNMIALADELGLDVKSLPGSCKFREKGTDYLKGK